MGGLGSGHQHQTADRRCCTDADQGSAGDSAQESQRGLKGECGLHRVWCRCSHHPCRSGEDAQGELVRPAAVSGELVVNEVGQPNPLA